MPAISATAPGKIILLGEHAVVYGFPAIAIPVHQVFARAIITPNPTAPPGKIQIKAPAINLQADLSELSSNHPIKFAILRTQETLQVAELPSFRLQISSSIPVASGLGSGAAVSVAIIRALANFLGFALSNDQVSALTYQIEQIHHGTPSGIDNTVVTYAQPVYFQRDQPVDIIACRVPLTFVIADSGHPSPTLETVSKIRQAWMSNPVYYESIFDQIGNLVIQARAAVENGDIAQLGSLMDDNQSLLEELQVSTPELDGLIAAARAAGAFGAKLSGGGCGGNMIALSSSQETGRLASALSDAGATLTITTFLPAGDNNHD